ncbi:S1 family peptidase [Actinoplanes sp. TRM 88003]|uniref:S1 family peptidase n=1 Tax=Paractinoplanes aksuensis TaxID=2939490 RepID=A0ABT1DRY4_9ACTN|nr:trypsin-like serine protease [Actinoplanes aksuensis]MCO8272770.1 S1 family peptidase [Actinoplanes aksuensis]
MFKLLAALAASALVVLGLPSPASAIAYGENARDGAYRFSVLLTMTGLPTPDRGTRDSSCSGALIAPTWVVTAGHCFRDAEGRKVSRTVAERTTATIGRTKVKGTGGHVLEVISVKQSETTDVALAELAEPVTGITPLRVATYPPSRGESLRLTGFGLTADQKPAQRMQTGRFTVDAVGDSLLETSGVAPQNDTSPCPHDSGGPYFRTTDAGPELVAVVSGGPGCPHTGPDFSARTDNISDWITATTSGSRSYQWWPAAVAAVGVGAVGLLVWAYRRTRADSGRRSGLGRRAYGDGAARLGR